MENEAEVQPIKEETPKVEENLAASNVGFPQPMPRKKGGAGKFIIIFLGLAILAVIGFLVFKGVNKSGSNPEATPSVESVNTSNENSAPTPSSTPTDKSTVSLNVMNGTGIAGEAGYLQDVLRSLGYTKIQVGNADSQNNTETTVTFSSLLSQDVIDEITTKLQGIYEKVNTSTSSTVAENSVQITTGLRKGATPKPAVTEAPTASPSSAPSGQ